MIIITILVLSCNIFEPDTPTDDSLLDGPVNGLTYEQNRQFLAGDVAFNDEIFTPATGLGPIFVATSCGSCHAGDGKGTPFTTLVRFGQTDSTGNQFLHLGGPQLQNRAIPGFQTEVVPNGATSSKFTPPANTGLGFLELVSDEDILSMSDPEDSNGDGISGVPSFGYLPEFITPNNNSVVKNGKYIHRFGKKAAAYNLLHQTVNAYNQDMGITSTFAPHDVYSGLETDPEVSNKTLNDVVFYLQTLKAPIQRDVDNPQNIEGKRLFKQINCSGCHTPQLQTDYSPVSALSNKTIYPYSDMLLHDMGTELDDGYTEGFAKTSEWRTPPLWGLGLSPNSQGGQYFLMHDGRARSIEQAILMHGGEAKKSRDSYNQLNQNEKDAIIHFLKSL
jgi:CxxC motif-containing protein (DUF1111 family)